MKIVHLNTYDIIGGAARSAYRLHQGLCRLGHHSSMFVYQGRSSDSTVLAFQPSRDLLSRVRRRWCRERITRSFARYQRSCPVGYELFSDDRSPHGRELFSQLPPRDIVQLHWVAGFVDYQPFFATVPQLTPVVWTLHDMNAFTGGCHYGLGCERYVSRCGACPQLGSSETADLASQIWQRKQRSFAQIPAGRIHFVTPSCWLADEVRRSTLGKHFPVSVIPYGVDIEDFTPRDRGTARDVLGVPREAKVVLFLADVVDNRRKGFALLIEALADLHNVASPFLLSLGRGKPPVETHLPWLHLGAIEKDRLLSLAYSAADLFVIPSLQDNLPNTVLEAMACGTPVVGFAVGGIPDMVRSGITGLLAPPENVAELRSAIVQLLQNPAQLAEMAINCRRVAVEEYALEVQARRYVTLYRTLLQRSDPALKGTRAHSVVRVLEEQVQYQGSRSEV